MWPRETPKKPTSEAFLAARHAYYQAEYARLGLNLPAPPKRKPRPLSPVPSLSPLPSIVLGEVLRAEQGRLVATGEPFGFEAEDLEGGLWIIGKNGSGKTITLERLAVADILAGRGCVVIDPAGDLTQNLLSRVPAERVDEVVLLDAGDPDALFGINPVWCPHPDNEDEVATYALFLRDAFKKVTVGWGAAMNDIIPSAAHILLANPGTSLADMPRLFFDAAFRERLMTRVTHPPVQQWRERYETMGRRQAGYVEATSSRIAEFLRDPRLFSIVTQSPQSVDFGRWTRERRIVLIKLPPGPGQLARDSVQLLGALILQQVKAAAWTRVHTLPEQERQPTGLYVDEFHRFATPEFGEMFRELRKSGVFAVIAHQDISQLKEYGVEEIPQAARNLFSFGIMGTDVTTVLRELHPEPQHRDRPLSVTPLADAPARLRTTRVLSLVHTLDAHARQAILDAEIAIENRGGRIRHTAFRTYRDHLENAVNRYLFACMQQRDVSDRAPLAVERAAGLLFAYSPSGKKRYLLALGELAEELAATPVYDTNLGELEPEEQARTRLGRQLTGFDTYQAYCRVNRGKRRTEQYVQMTPLPWPVFDWASEQKQARIRANMLAQGIIRPRRPTPPDAGEAVPDPQPDAPPPTPLRRRSGLSRD